MDTKKEYIKQCDCPEIQDGHKYINGDFIQVSYDPCSRDDPAFGAYVEKHVSVFSVHNSYLGDFIWLPRQDQIQEMMLPDYSNDVSSLVKYFWKFFRMCPEGLLPNNITETMAFIYNSMERLWLGFYMSENHQKIWNGDKWIKSE